jgi:hypothetical protein
MLANRSRTAVSAPRSRWRGEGRGRRRRRLVATGTAVASLPALLLVGACSGPPGAGRRLGDDLGTFSVEASEVDGGCGGGALGSAPRFRFDVELSRADFELFWDARVGGTIDESLEFELATSTSVELRPARGADPGCAVLRDDFIWGVLQTDAAGTVMGFTGNMRFSFKGAEGSACTLDDTAEADLQRLPCSLSYELEGSRTRAPEP